MLKGFIFSAEGCRWAVTALPVSPRSLLPRERVFQVARARVIPWLQSSKLTADDRGV